MKIFQFHQKPSLLLIKIAYSYQKFWVDHELSHAVDTLVLFSSKYCILYMYVLYVCKLRSFDPISTQCIQFISDFSVNCYLFFNHWTWDSKGISVILDLKMLWADRKNNFCSKNLNISLTVSAQKSDAPPTSSGSMKNAINLSVIPNLTNVDETK